MLNRTRLSLAVLIVGIILSVPVQSQGGPGGGGLVPYLQSLPLEALSSQETTLILQMRQEEKLARDLYLQLAQTWSLPIFANIANAEQQHMNFMAFLVTRYGLVDPVANDPAGVFQDPTFQQVYDVLLLVGQVSPAHALLVGNIIEDVDIRDLNAGLTVADNRDLRAVLQNLNKGSRNHERAFYPQLQALGWQYTPIFLDLPTLLAIVQGPIETGVYDENGNPI
ncbi:MAG: DUF2202 domain-containing protein [Planctomycetes bacterium]|nr:DUF2202 domain-containing protein [Planctomycetota bacterium]